MSKRKIMALLLAVVMVCTLFVSPALAAEGEGEPVAISKTEAPKFTDVDGHWAESAINRWAEDGIIEGDGDGTVNPQRNLKRAELATILTRLLGLKAKAPANTFKDVAADAWYADAVLKCAQAGIMLGDGTGKANPEAPIDRQQTIVMVGRALGVKPAAGNSLDRFNDADDVADWAKPYMTALTDMGILNGLPTGDGAFVIAPEVNINRASTFTLLDKAIAKYVTAPCTVTVDDANKFVVINSAAEEKGTVTVTGKAAGVVVGVGTTDDVVFEKATVATVKVDAPVSVTVAKGSSAADLDANAAAKIDNKGTVTNLNTNASGVVFDGNKPAKVTTAKDVTPAKDSKGKEVTAQGATSGSTGGSSRPTVVRADLVPAPLADQAPSNAIDADKLGKVTVDSRRTALTDNVPTYEVTVTGRDIMNHNNANQTPGHWVGFGMPAKVVAEGEAASSYTYEVNDSVIASIASRTYEVNGKTYNTVYFSEENNGSYADYTIVVKDGAKTVAIYNVKFDVTFKSDYTVSMMAELSEELLKAYDDENLPIRHKTAAGLGLTAAVSGDTMTLTGTTTLAKLEATVAGAAGNDGYVLYAMNVGNTDIKKIKTGVSTYTLADFEVEGLSNAYLMNTKIYDGAAKTLLNNTVEIELLDANDRVQGKISQTFQATGVAIEGMKKVTFVDGETRKTVMVSEANVIAPAVTAESEGDTYYTGKWVVGETVYAAGAAIPVTDGMTVTAESKTVTVQVTDVRVDGPEGSEPNFKYEEAYTAAGLTLANNVITVDAAKLLEYAKDAGKFDHLRGVNSDGQRNNRVVMGVEYTTPTVDGAAITKFATAATLEGLASANVRELSSYPENKLISYTDVAKYENGKVVFLPDSKQDGATVETGEKLDGRPYTKWMDNEGNVLAVTKVILERKTTPAKFTVTFKDGDAIKATKEVAYGEKVGALEAGAKDGYLFLNWADKDGNPVDFNAAITADVTYTAKWAPVTDVSDVEVIIGTVPTKLGITATQYANGEISFTVDEAAFKAAWETLSETEKGQLEHAGHLYVRVNFAVPEGADEDWTFIGSTNNGETWRDEVHPFNKTNLNAVGLDVTEEGGKIVKLGQWFGIATVTTETTGEGEDAVTTTKFVFPEAKTWTVLYKWTDKAGNVQFTTFELTREVELETATAE